MRILDDKCFDAESLTFDSRNHAFNVGIAKDYNPNMGLWLAHLAFWAEKNLANNTNIHDGLVWCYDTIEALGDYFPYLSKSQRETMINNSVKHGLVVTGNYNHTTYDRTVWYALTPKSYFYFPHLVTEKYIKRLFLSISEKSEMDLREFGNGFPGFRMTIPDTDPDTDPDKKSEGDTAPSPTIKKFPTAQERNEKAAYENVDIKKLFTTKFTGLNVTYDQLYQDCKEHYESKRQWVTTKKWKLWLDREKLDQYTKIAVTSSPKYKPVFTTEESQLMQEALHAKKMASCGQDINIFIKPEKLALAEELLARAKAMEAPKCQNHLPEKSARKNCSTSASNLVSHLNLYQQGS